MPVCLAGEASPHLLQPANNPVDGYPWGQTTPVLPFVTKPT
jgi:uncharacterized protein YyaL (SSP411 family)